MRHREFLFAKKLDYSGIREREISASMRRNVTSADDDVVKQANLENLAGVGKRFRDADVACRRR